MYYSSALLWLSLVNPPIEPLEVLIFRWGDYFLLHRAIVKINAYITKKNLEQVCIFKIHSETSLSFNLPNFLPQSHSQLIICFIFLQIQNNEKRKSKNSHHHLTLLTSLCAKIFCLPACYHRAGLSVHPSAHASSPLPLANTRSPHLQCSSLFPVLSFPPL